MILLHGLWFSGWVMAPLRRSLGRHGFRTAVFSYPTVRQGLDDNARRLERFCRAQPGDTLHLVGHSLGGLVALRMLALAADARPGRIVLLGTPLGGSLVARRLSRSRVGRLLVGRSLAQWQPSAFPGGREIGMIAGTGGAGMGRLIAPIDSPNDGTVAVSETRHPGLTDHRCLPVSHSGLLLSSGVAHEVVHFLRQGHFAPGAVAA